MKHLISIVLIICLIIPFNSLAETATETEVNEKREIYKYIDFNVFDNIRWGDSADDVKKLFGYSRLESMYVPEISWLIYEDVPFGSFKSTQCQFIFWNNELTRIVFLFLDTDFGEGFEFLYDSLIFGFNASLGDYDEEISEEYEDVVIWHIPDGTDFEIRNHHSGKSVSLMFRHNNN